MRPPIKGTVYYAVETKNDYRQLNIPQHLTADELAEATCCELLTGDESVYYETVYDNALNDLAEDGDNEDIWLDGQTGELVNWDILHEQVEQLQPARHCLKTELSPHLTDLQRLSQSHDLVGVSVKGADTVLVAFKEK